MAALQPGRWALVAPRPASLPQGVRQLSSDPAVHVRCRWPRVPGPARSAYLAVDVLLEVQLLLQSLQPVLGIDPPQHLVLKLLLGLPQGCLELRGSGRERVSWEGAEEWGVGCTQRVPSYVWDRSRERASGATEAAVPPRSQ